MSRCGLELAPLLAWLDGATGVLPEGAAEKAFTPGFRAVDSIGFTKESFEIALGAKLKVAAELVSSTLACC